MADSTTEIDLDSVIDRLLEGELASLDFYDCDCAECKWGQMGERMISGASGVVEDALLPSGRSITL
jgi:hypothetical protein